MFKPTLMYFYNDDYSSASGGSASGGNANVPPAQELNRDAWLSFETSVPGQSDTKETEN